MGACGSSANPWPSDQKFLCSDVSLRLLSDPRAIPYLGPNLPLGATTSACPLVADRVSMPRKAAVVLLMAASLLVGSVLGTIQTAKFRGNGTERLIGKCHLLWAPRLRRLMLPSDCVTRIHFRDDSDCYYACSVDEDRSQRQVLGPRVPVSWFRNEPRSVAP